MFFLVPIVCVHIQFYKNLANHAVSNGHVIDIFACCLDQTGGAEQRILCDLTGGTLTLSDTFTTNVFINSFGCLFFAGENGLSMVFNGGIRIRCSNRINVSGCIGAVSRMKEQSHCVSNHEVGLTQTTKWSCGSMFPTSTFCFIFDIAVSNQTNDKQDGTDEYGNIQFITTHPTSFSTNVTHVTTFDIQVANQMTLFFQPAQTSDDLNEMGTGSAMHNGSRTNSLYKQTNDSSEGYSGTLCQNSFSNMMHTLVKEIQKSHSVVRPLPHFMVKWLKIKRSSLHKSRLKKLTVFTNHVLLRDYSKLLIANNFKLPGRRFVLFNLFDTCLLDASTMNVWNEPLSTPILPRKQTSQWRYEHKQKILNKKRAAQGRRHRNHGRGNNNGHGDSGNGNGKLWIK